jgi:hypothetical protein
MVQRYPATVARPADQQEQLSEKRTRLKLAAL